jgi:hypothetical protein
MIFNQEPDIENKIKELFLKNPTLSRPDRKPPPRRFSIKGQSRNEALASFRRPRRPEGGKNKEGRAGSGSFSGEELGI